MMKRASIRAVHLGFLAIAMLLAGVFVLLISGGIDTRMRSSAFALSPFDYAVIVPRDALSPSLAPLAPPVGAGDRDLLLIGAIACAYTDRKIGPPGLPPIKIERQYAYRFEPVHMELPRPADGIHRIGDEEIDLVAFMRMRFSVQSLTTAIDSGAFTDAMESLDGSSFYHAPLPHSPSAIYGGIRISSNSRWIVTESWFHPALVYLAIGLGISALILLVWSMRMRRELDTRFANDRCTECGYPFDQRTTDDTCIECGAPIVNPHTDEPY